MRFGLQDFYDRVASRDGTEPPLAAFHAHAVLRTLCEAVSPGEIQDVLAGLPREFHMMFVAPRGREAAA